MNCSLDKQEAQGALVPETVGAPCQVSKNEKTPLGDPTHGDLSNTGGLISQGPISKGSINWLSVAIYVNWHTTDWNRARQLLNDAKYTARGKGSQEITFGGHRAIVMARAPEMGNKRSRVRMAFCLIIEGIQFMLADCRAAGGSAPNVMVQVPGLQCLRYTLPEILALVRSVIRLAGGAIIAEKLSRVDLALDLLDVSMDPFWQAFMEERFVTRVKHHWHIGGTEGRSLYFGKVPLTLCVYDKRAQLKTKSDLQVSEEAYYLHRLWGTNFVTDVTRVEFRLFRDTLRQHGIDSPADFQGKLPDLIGYLTSKWFRFTEGPVDRMNAGRALTLPLWTKVAEGFQQWAGAPQGASLAPLAKLPLATEQLAKQLLGLALTHAARVHGRALTVVETLDHIRAVLAQEIVRINLQEAYATRLA